MRFSAPFALLLTLVAVAASPALESEALERRTVSSGVYNDLVFYFKYASSSYTDSCTRPNGNTFVATINDRITDTQGFIARDDTKKEIVVVFRGSTSTTDFIVDADTALVAFTSPGVSAPTGTRVHRGFLTAWNSVASDVISAVRSQLAAHPGYSIATSGHSLGGALSSLAGISLQQNFPDVPLRMFTYGQPRTGNPAYATFVNSKLGANVFRGVHTADGVPTTIPTSLGYRHHGVEYWQNPDPSSASTVKQCAADGEDPTCSASIPSGGINTPHLTYYNIQASTTFCS